MEKVPKLTSNMTPRAMGEKSASVMIFTGVDCIMRKVHHIARGSDKLRKSLIKGISVKGVPYCCS